MHEEGGRSTPRGWHRERGGGAPESGRTGATGAQKTGRPSPRIPGASGPVAAAGSSAADGQRGCRPGPGNGCDWEGWKPTKLPMRIITVRRPRAGTRALGAAASGPLPRTRAGRPSRLKQNGPSRGSGAVSRHTLPHPTAAAVGAGAATGAKPRLGGGGVRPEVAGCGFSSGGVLRRTGTSLMKGGRLGPRLVLGHAHQ